MKPSRFGINRAAGLRAALAVVICSSGVQGANLLTATPGSISLTCSTTTGPGTAANVVVKPVTPLTTKTIAVTFGAVSGGVVVTAPSTTVLNSENQAKGLTYTINLAAGCAGATAGSTTVRFFAGGVADVSIAVKISVTATASPLVTAPVTLTCVRNAGPPPSYSPGAAQTVSITSAAAGGTPFTVDTASIPPWLTVTPAAGGVAGTTGVPLSMTPVSPCGNYLPGTSNAASIRLRNQPAPDALIPVTLNVVNPSPVTAAPASPSLTYTKGSETPAFVDVVLSSTASSSATFAVDPATLPTWLSVDVSTGSLPKTLRFSSTKVADAIAPGVYSATVRVQVSGVADVTLPFRFAVSNPAPKLTVGEGTTRDITWTAGQALPLPSITLISSGSAIPYVISTSGPLTPIIGANHLKGFAYSYGTTIPVAFEPAAFAVAQPGNVLTGSVTVSWGTPATKTVVTFNITAQAAGATVTGINPRNLPTAGPGESFIVALTGSGFVSASDPASRTVVGIVSGGALAANANIAASVINSSNIILTITVPASPDPLLPFSPTGPGGTVTLGVCNPSGGSCRTATATAQVSIGSVPVIQSVTSASSYLQASPPALPEVAPYDMVSVFGINFCSSGGTGCGDGVLYGRPDAATLRFPSALSPDAEGTAQRFLTVTFQTHANPPVVIANAPLLFATDGQINLLVPSGVAAFAGKAVDMVVKFGAAGSGVLSGTGIKSSEPFAVNVVPANPGIFTVGGDGQGEGAILARDGGMITLGNEAGVRQNAADSDVVQIFMTGLGAPDSTAENAAAGTGQWPADCVSVASYLTAVQAAAAGTVAAVDGVAISSQFLNSGRMAPCLRSSAAIPTVTIGGQAATVTYAGWAPDSVAGQYQVNVRLPAAGSLGAGPLTAPAQVPVVVTARGRASQAGVTMWVAPRLTVSGPTAAGLRGTAGVSWGATGNLVAASGGTGPYQYSVTSGSLPPGLSLHAVTGALSGTPAPDAVGSYTVTVTATDSAGRPLSGSVTFTLTVVTSASQRP